MIFCIKIPYSEGVVIAGGKKIVILGVDDQVGNAISVTLENLYDSILVYRPVEDQMVLLGCHKNCIVVVSVC